MTDQRDDDPDDEPLRIPDRPLASRDHTTAAEQVRGEGLDTRIAREQPERTEPDERPGALIEPGDEDGNDVNAELIASEVDSEDEGDERSPEERAMHYEDEDAS